MKLTKLQRAVIKRLGDADRLSEINEHGAQAGWPGFISYAENSEFFRKNRALIQDALIGYAKTVCENPLEAVKGFPCLNNDYTTDEIARVLYGRWKDDDVHAVIANGLTWFALELVAYELTD